MSAYFARKLVALTTALILGGTLCATAYAEEPEPTTTTETSAPATETSAPVVEPVPVVEPEPDTKPEADLADPAVTVKFIGGPYLTGQTVPVEITVTNSGPGTAKGVKGRSEFVSGSQLNLEGGYGELGSEAGASIPAGEKLVVTTRARVGYWEGPPVARFTITSENDSSADNNSFDMVVPVLPPDSGSGSISVLVYGDANGNGVADAGEGLENAVVQVSPRTGGERFRTGADGRLRVGDLPLRQYEVDAEKVPGGWLLESSTFRYVDVDGDEFLEFRAVRPLSDQLEASIAFTEDIYDTGQTARMTVVLTNKGGTDISGVKAGCDRKGGDTSHVTTMDLGDLAPAAAGVTVAAGASKTLTITGVVPSSAVYYASVSVVCDFGPGTDPSGRPAVDAVARVRTTLPPSWLRGLLFQDLNDDGVVSFEERLPNVRIAAIDRFTGLVVAETVTIPEGKTARGSFEFTSLPAGPYELKLLGPWKFEFGQPRVVVGNCGVGCGGPETYSVLPAPDPTPEPPTTEPTPTPTPTVPPAGGGGESTGGGLASTGASTIGLTAFGVLSLLAGIGAVVVTRRRRSA